MEDLSGKRKELSESGKIEETVWEEQRNCLGGVDELSGKSG